MNRKRLRTAGWHDLTQVRNEHTYWELEKLTARGAEYQVRPKYQSNLWYWGAQHLYERLQRGLLLYQTCKPKELRKFLARRKIQFALNRSKWTMIHALEAADEGTTFENFLDLPPELREQIYMYHLKDLETLGFPREPPITRVSRLSRRESIPLFYDICRFECVRPTSLFQHCPEAISSRLRSLALRTKIRCTLVNTEWDITIKRTGEVDVKLLTCRETMSFPRRLQEMLNTSLHDFDRAQELHDQKLREVREGIQTVMNERVRVLSVGLRGRSEQFQLAHESPALFAALSEDINLELGSSVDA